MTYRAEPAAIFDPQLLRTRLARAERQGGGNFLMPGLVEDLIERLRFIRRDFDTVVDIGSLADLRPRIQAVLPTAKITRVSPIPQTDAQVVFDERLPAFPRPYSLAVSLLAFQCVNDLPGLLVQIANALKPDGLLLAAMLGGQTLRELRTAFTIAEAEIAGGASPHVAPFADVRDVGGLLQRAGFALPVADSETLTVRYADAFGLFRDLRAMGGTNALVERLRRPMRKTVLLRAMEIYRRDYSDDDGRVRATFEIIWMSGWRPHESQQKPLKPGSAAMRLADVLPTKTYD